MAKEIWFIRHGESLANAGAATADVKNVPLSDIGFKEAEELSLKFDKAPDLLIASPYIRTQQTAEPLRNKFSHITYEIWDVQEFTCLDTKLCANTTKFQREPIAKAFWEKLDTNFVHGEGAESFSNLIYRVRNALNKIKERDEQFIVIITHGFFLKALLQLIAHPEYSDLELMTTMLPSWYPVKIANCEIIKFQYDNDKLKLISKKE